MQTSWDHGSVAEHRAGTEGFRSPGWRTCTTMAKHDLWASFRTFDLRRGVGVIRHFTMPEMADQTSLIRHRSATTTCPTGILLSVVTSHHETAIDTPCHLLASQRLGERR